MSRARPNDSQIAVDSTSRGSGCCSAYLIPPLAVVLVGSLLAVFAFSFSSAGFSAEAASSTPSSTQAASADPIPAPPAAPGALLTLSFPGASVQAAAPGAIRIAPIFTPEVQFWGESLVRWAASAGVDPNLAAAVMQIESCGDPSATSRAGAIGLFQVMPYHFAAGDSPYDPDTNALRGLDYLRRALAAASSDARLAMAGYNGGISVIGRSELTWPAETIRYAYWGGGIYADALSGAGQSSRLQEWLAAGGSGLCSRASQRLGLNN